MQKFSTIIFALLALALVSFKKKNSGIEEVINAIRSGNANELAKYIDGNVEISLPDKTGSYSKAQTVIILQDFFNNNTVKSFELKHKGDNGGSQFCIGTLNTRSGLFRTTVFMRTKNGRQEIKQIGFQAL
ncbi:MAG: DUF4783 domain-containing protein [Chitinophagaceae bacterium]